MLDSARNLVYERGPRAATVDEIAASAGVGKQTIYRWWPTKSAVIMDALAELTDPEQDDLPTSTYEAIRLQMRRVAGMFASRQGRLIKEAIADALGDPSLAEDFRRRFFAHRRARGAKPIASGIASGELRQDLNIDDVLDLLYGPIWLSLIIGHRPMGPRAVDRLLVVVWPGLVNHDPSPLRVTSISGPTTSP